MVSIVKTLTLCKTGFAASVLLSLVLTTGPAYAEVKISRVTAHPAQIDVGEKELSKIRFQINTAAEVVISVYDARDRLVAKQQFRGALEAGSHSWSWDGKDLNGIAVPPEAYFYTIDATDTEGQTTKFDLTDKTGGVEVEPSNIVYDAEKEKVTLALPRAARLYAHMDIHRGPMVGTLIGGEVRARGKHEEHWNGKDPSGNIYYPPMENLYFISSGYTLPENAIIVSNSETSGRWANLAENGEKRQRGFRKVSTPSNSHFAHDRLHCKEYRLILSVSGTGLPGSFKQVDSSHIVKENSYVRVDLPENDRAILEAERTELVLFVDNILTHHNQFSMLPFTWKLEADSYNTGTHNLNIFVASYDVHFGIGAMQFEIK